MKMSVGLHHSFWFLDVGWFVEVFCLALFEVVLPAACLKWGTVAWDERGE